MRPGFNPRSRVGSDACPVFLRHEEGTFQSTLPCRERQLSAKYGLTQDFRFNPRSRVGSDQAAH